MWDLRTSKLRTKGRGRIVIELSGGNDGLITVVPFADDLDAKARPRLRVEPNTVLKLDDRMGLNPAVKELYKVWESGDLAVVQGAGYPNPNRSHFRSMEIWQTGLVGPVPDLANLDDGDLKFSVDIRDIYATLLRRWLKVGPLPVLGGRNEAMPIV